MKRLCEFILLGAVLSPIAQAQSGDALLNLLEDAVVPIADTNSIGDANSVIDDAIIAEAQNTAEPNLPSPPVLEPNMPPPGLPEPNALAAAETVQMQNTPAEKESVSSNGTVVGESQRLRKAMLAKELEPVAALSSEQQEANLNRLIEQLNNLQTPVEAPKMPLNEDPNTEKQNANNTAAMNATSAPSMEAAAEPMEAASDPNAAAAQMLTRLQNAESVVNPLRLADALFRQGHMKEAFVYYVKAAAQIPQEETETRQWILFQMANCCAATDALKAKELYSELLSRFPNSAWSSSAKSRLSVLEWMMSDAVQKSTGTGEYAQR